MTRKTGKERQRERERRQRENTIVGDSKHTGLNTCDKKDTTSRGKGMREIHVANT